MFGAEFFDDFIDMSSVFIYKTTRLY